LNPLRAKVVPEISQLNKYSYCGHSVLTGRVKRQWQDTEYVLSYFGQKLGEARSLLFYWAVRELGFSGTFLAERFGMSQPGVVYSVYKGEKIAKENGYKLAE